MFGESFKEKEDITFTFGIGYQKDLYYLDFALRKYYLNEVVEDDQPQVNDFLCSISLPF